MTFGLDITRSLDPSLLLSDAGYTPYPWQCRAMRSRSKRKAWNIHRQGAKTTTAGVLALDVATSQPGSLVVCMSPSQRQSSEWLRSTLQLYHRIAGLPPLIAESAHRIELHGRSRILSLPQSESTIRGFARLALLILDEASRIPDETIDAVMPSLALSGGSIVALSTPFGRRGRFWEWCTKTPGWEVETITAAESGIIDPDFLAEELRTKGPLLYSQEYECAFIDNEFQVFSTALFDRCVTDEVKPLWSC